MKKETLWICGRPWEVNFLGEAIVNDNNNVEHGDSDGDTQVIRVTEKDTCPDATRETTLHESIHSSLKTVSNGFPSGEEDAVQALTVGFYSAFRDPRNLWLWKYMLEGIAVVKEKRRV